MTDNNDKDRKPEGSRPAGGTLTLKRPSIEQSKVKQSFGAGRSKTVVVETKRKRIGDEKPGAAQHTGLGSQLLDAAAQISRQQGFRRLSVIAATGTRGYYAARGFTLGELYMHKELP